MPKLPRAIHAIVDEQVRRWNAERLSRAKDVPPRHWPVVVVSRQYGAQGAALARLVADGLSFPLWDREILHEIAQHSGALETLFASLDEHRRHGVIETISGLGPGPHVSASGYRVALLRVLHTLGAHGGAVIVGRGAQFVLGPDHALRVRAVAPLEERVRGLARRRGLSELEARQDVATIETERRNFIRDLFGRDDDEPAAYDLVVNTATVPLARAAALVLEAYRARFGSLPSEPGVAATTSTPSGTNHPTPR